MTIANLITLLRIVLVPVIVWAMLSDFVVLAFFVFLLAGLSDAVDGAVARMMNQQSRLGTLLDPIADKIMLVSMFVLLAYLGEVPLSLVILIVSRDILIICGVVMALLVLDEVHIRPLWVSKATTLAQILLASTALGAVAFQLDWDGLRFALEWLTGILTAVSAIAYVVQGIRVFSAVDSGTTASMVQGTASARKRDKSDAKEQ